MYTPLKNKHESKMGREEYILNAAKLLKLYTIKDMKILKIEPSGLSIYIA